MTHNLKWMEDHEAMQRRVLDMDRVCFFIGDAIHRLRFNPAIDDTGDVCIG